MNERLFWMDLRAPEPSLEPPAYNPPERYCDNCAYYTDHPEFAACWGCIMGRDPLSLDYASVCPDYMEGNI